MEPNGFNIKQEDGQMFPATAFPKKVSRCDVIKANTGGLFFQARGVPPVMDKTRQKRNTRKLQGENLIERENLLKFQISRSGLEADKGKT